MLGLGLGDSGQVPNFRIRVRVRVVARFLRKKGLISFPFFCNFPPLLFANNQARLMSSTTPEEHQQPHQDSVIIVTDKLGNLTLIRGSIGTMASKLM